MSSAQTLKNTESEKRRTGGRPAAADPAQQRARILNAALAHFARRGFDGASLRAIATEAGVAHGLIRHYFRNKDDLWLAAADHIFGQVVRALANSPDTDDAGDPVARIEARVRAFVHMSSRVPHLAGFMLQAGLAGGVRFDHLIETYVRPLYQQVLGTYQRAIDKGKAAPLDAHFIFIIATNAATAPFAQAAVSKALSGRDLHDPETADAYADVLIRVLLGGTLKPEEARKRGY
jgi:TetR/AcrR family transcriptional regulator